MFLESHPQPGRRLGPDDTFRFHCHSELGCFNRCCGNKQLPLTPYDVLRLTRALGLHSDEFLSRYGEYRVDPASGFPIVSLRMSGDPGKSCPLVGRHGCSVYEDRPTACRLFPLGRSSRVREGKLEEVFVLLPARGCMGLREQTRWRLRQWTEDQGLTPFLEMNDKMLSLLFHPGRRVPLSPRQMQQIFVVCYNPDVFREFILSAAFTRHHALDPATRSRIQTDDRFLLEQGIGYLKGTLFQ